MDDAEKKQNDKNKKGFTWTNDLSEPEYSDYAGSYEPREEDYDWDEDRYDPSAQACQSIHYASDTYSEWVDSVEMDEPQEQARATLIQRGREVIETAEFDVHRLVDSLEQRDKEHKATLDRILTQTSPLTIWEKIQDNILSYIITAIIGGFLVYVGLTSAG